MGKDYGKFVLTLNHTACFLNISIPSCSIMFFLFKLCIIHNLKIIRTLYLLLFFCLPCNIYGAARFVITQNCTFLKVVQLPDANSQMSKCAVIVFKRTIHRSKTKLALHMVVYTHLIFLFVFKRLALPFLHFYFS